MSESFKQRSVILCVMTMFLLLISATAFAAPADNFRLMSQSNSQIEIKFNLGEWNLQTKNENGNEIKSIVSDARNNLYVGEDETLPLYSTMIAIPEGMDVELVTNVTRRQDLSNVNLVNSSVMQQERNTENFYPHRQFAVSEPGQMRDFRVVTVNVYPFQVNTANNELGVVEEANLTLRLVPSRDSYLNAHSGTYSRAYDRIYRGLILNYDNLRDELTPTAQPVMLVIYPSGGDTTFNNKLSEYVVWKKQKGYVVNLASTAVTGTTSTSIKSYIQGAYNNISTRPDVILIIGDVSGTYGVATNVESTTGWTTSNGDYSYTLLAGGDYFGDAQIGRISISSSTEFSAYVAKVYAVERDIDIPSSQWLNRMLLVGDYSSSGISTIYTNQLIHEISYLANPSYQYTELYSGTTTPPSPTAVNQAINLGVGFYNYRGYIGMSGWSPGASLINGLKLNHGVFITCSTGNIANTATTEAYVRLGSEAVPAGGITAIGMDTSSTHTAFNNTLDIALFSGLFSRGMNTMGEALLFSKNNLQNVYGSSAQNTAIFFNRICNLIGDPTVEVWKQIPSVFNVTAPTTILSGTSTLQVIVKNASNAPMHNVTVNLWQAASNLNLTVYTDASGRAYFNIPTNLTGNIILTVSQHDYKPVQQTIAVSGSGMVYYGSLIDDDSSGASFGNNNGVINAGETIEYKVQLRNSSGSTISGISATVSHTDPYVQFGFTSSLTFPNATAGSIVTSTNTITFTVNNACPDNHPVNFNLAVNSSAGLINIPVQHIVRAADLDYVSHTITGANSYLEIGETANMYVTVTNSGTETASAVYGKLRSLHYQVAVLDSVKYFGNISSGSTYSNSSTPFSVYANAGTITGMVIPMELVLYNASGYTDTEAFTLTIGNTTVTDPVGQDEYGYFIFDMGDAGYPQCPTYNWIGIAPAEGGSGTLLSTISDTAVDGHEGDLDQAVSLEAVNLPFTFKFYGIDYNQITVCSNGFIAFGITNNGDFRNGRLPGPAGPNPMIAAFWDDLVYPAGSGIYKYYDPVNHLYIIEWYNAKNGDNTSMEETFQVILHNPSYYPTSTGDGPIKIQYKVFNNADIGGQYEHGVYSTVGIKDHTGLRGLEYTYNNQYPVAAQPLGNQKALYITTLDIPDNQPFLSITQTNLVDTNSNGIAEPGETLDVRLTVSNAGSVTANNVTVSISESDPWINITSNTAAFGNIAAGGSGVNTSGLIITVLPGAPSNYSAIVNAVVTCSGYSFNRTFSIDIYTPELEFGYTSIQDVSGNNNGQLDPGETATVVIALNNLGGAPSLPGSATLTCSTTGITVNNGTANFGAISQYGTAYLNFTVTASSSVPIATIAEFVYNATAGSVTANKTDYISIGLLLEDFESGNFNMYPWTFSGTADWVIDSTEHYSGVYSARSGTITHSQSTTMQTVRVLSAPGPITFWYKVSSESNYDYLRFYVDGVQQNQWSGTVGWTQANYNLSAGVRTLAWTYYKDGSVSSGSDCAWVDYIIFPASTSQSVYNPPTNLSASASHMSVLLTWSAPGSGTPTGYKIYKNGGLLTTVTGLTYTDLAVVNGTSYSYYVKAAYNGGDSDPTDTVNATPNAIAPTNLVGVGGNGYVSLTWNGATGRQEYELNTSDARAISGYKVYRNGSLIATVAGTSHQDTNVINETTYTYYVTTVYSNPAGESAPSASIQATPSAQLPTIVILGSGTASTGSSEGSPINIWYKSLHGQSVYTAAELNAAGVYGPATILQLGFYIASSPDQALPNFIIRIKHTSATNVESWQTLQNMVTVYTNASYMPLSGGYELLTLSSPFTWNGVDNIVIDTAFSPVLNYTTTGTVRYTAVENGYRYVRQDSSDQTNVFAGGEVSSFRPNVKLTFQPQVQLSAPEVSVSHTGTGCRVSWPAVNGATRYLVLASDECEDGFVQIAEVTTTQYTDTSAHNTRFYKVIAADGAPARAWTNKE